MLKKNVQIYHMYRCLHLFQLWSFLLFTRSLVIQNLCLTGFLFAYGSNEVEEKL